jgi:hypothetical protein
VYGKAGLENVALCMSPIFLLILLLTCSSIAQQQQRHQQEELEEIFRQQERRLQQLKQQHEENMRPMDVEHQRRMQEIHQPKKPAAQQGVREVDKKQTGPPKESSVFTKLSSAVAAPFIAAARVVSALFAAIIAIICAVAAFALGSFSTLFTLAPIVFVTSSLVNEYLEFGHGYCAAMGVTTLLLGIFVLHINSKRGKKGNSYFTFVGHGLGCACWSSFFAYHGLIADCSQWMVS